ncbi:MAG: ubiquinone/menaquinone biosynthesis methyltransferase [Oligoflexia bacterium]|nr:ubiquinone/menaquinone biosynthesis methyltransferase [Oligoflexia bacterium]
MNYARTSSTVREMFGSIADRYDLANTVLSGGIHHLWRRKLLRAARREQVTSALDLCTGTADLAALLEPWCTKVIGADFCLPMLRRGKHKLRHATSALLQGDALKLPFRDCCFDLVTVAFGVRNFEDTEAGLTEIARVLRPGGRLLVLEFGQPALPLWSKIYNLYAQKVLPLIGGAVSGNRAAYSYLQRTSAEFPCRSQFVELLRRSGFGEAHFTALTGGIAYLYEARRV